MKKCDECGGELTMIDDHLCQCPECKAIYSATGRAA
jgi:predicted anti-sigma-YlaC factor YlaD